MQTGKKAVESVKGTASNIAASAKSGAAKTKATVQEKVDKMYAIDDFEKVLATQCKEERIAEAEQRKQEAKLAAASARTANVTGGSRTGGPN